MCICRKSFARVKNKARHGILVENHSTRAARRNPFFFVENYITMAIDVENRAKPNPFKGVEQLSDKQSLRKPVI
jgi:hypothetical protein